MQRKVLVLMAVSGLATGGAMVTAGSASAACDVFEICLYELDNGGGGAYETIVRNVNHGNVIFNNGVPVRNHADSVRNRDSQCDIKVVDDRGWYPDDVHTIPNDGVLRNLISSVDNENDRHEQGGCD